jgi:hypothetical protein
MVQLMYPIDGWKNVKKITNPLIMHCVNKVKGYLNFHTSNLKLLQNKKVQIILISEQHSECNNYEQYWLLISATSHLQI